MRRAVGLGVDVGAAVARRVEDVAAAELLVPLDELVPCSK